MALQIGNTLSNLKSALGNIAAGKIQTKIASKEIDEAAEDANTIKNEESAAALKRTGPAYRQKVAENILQTV
ncbi:hypothetical protein [Xylophilus sp. GOD-11R]|uniref:hypothetical protein n=1 Tax=Xylophilus sp. GOD-11R TaxID=3089814 RepID=UPI00298C67D7|nr:hypothetical protein [Xylophilus sp. GOD-11R]WPB57936.1 hypothetical protein R9X41_04630 [Xylophilus sp. GOD-11R]